MSADGPTDAEMLAECQADLARCLAALWDASDALWSIMSEAESGRFGRPGYDLTLDHIYETASPAYDTVRAAYEVPEAPATPDVSGGTTALPAVGRPTSNEESI